ncbi:MAG: hypothetical protein IPL61_22940 [Myxococcales bacterium]|nr:hypothetical protein [Myxococcales bacterium]
MTPPSARADLTREVDLIEDVLRVVGYGHVPATLPALTSAPRPLVATTADRARHALAGAGLTEAITFGFQAQARLDGLGLPADDRRAQPIAVRNPMSADQAIMRTSLVPNLLAAVARNVSFGLPDVALFEVGSVFLRAEGQATTGEPTALAHEPVAACVVLAGARPRRLGPAEPWDAFDAKGFALTLVRALGGGEATVAATTAVPYLHPGVAAAISVGGRVIGCVGEVHPDVRAHVGIDAAVFIAEVDLSGFRRAGARPDAPGAAVPGVVAGRVVAPARGGAGRRGRATPSRPSPSRWSSGSRCPRSIATLPSSAPTPRASCGRSPTGPPTARSPTLRSSGPTRRSWPG